MKHILIAAVAASFATSISAETPAERGQYLVETVMGCGNCHTASNPDGTKSTKNLTGMLVEDNEMFTAIATNITPAGAIADWSDEELARAIREGIRPDGSIIGPPMPFAAYRSISDNDLAAIVAYLRTVPAEESALPISEYRFPLPPAYGPPVGSVTAPEAGVTAEYGEYLVALGHCMECHSPMTPKGPDWGEGFARGGFEFRGPWGTSISSNLTDHPDGLAEYADDEIKAMITSARRPDGADMLPPMPYPYLAKMTTDDLDAMVLYLRSIPGKPDL